MDKINLFRFDDNEINFTILNEKKRIYSNNKHKEYIVKYISVSTDYIIQDNTHIPIDNFKINIEYKYIVLTNYEKIIFLNNFKKARIISVENFISEKFNIKDIETRYNKLLELSNSIILKNINKFNTIFKEFTSFYQHKTARKLKFKSSLDNNFFYSYKHPFSEAFISVELQKNRKIYLLDVNSMYPFVITYDNYTDPSKMIYNNSIDINFILSNKINNGIFKVNMHLKNDNNFIKKYNTLKFIKNNISFPFEIDKSNEIQTILHANEIQYYSKFFNIEIVDGIYSEKSISHPLKNIAIDLFKKRSEAKKDNNILLSSYYKKAMVSIYSYSNINKFSLFKNKKFKFINTKMGNIFHSNNTNNFNNLVKLKRVSYDAYDFSLIDNNNYTNIFSLSSQIVANANIYLLSLYEKIYKADRSFELAYANIDSLHISLPANKEDKFLSLLNKENIVGPNLGQMKIEGIGSIGLWLDIGKYWILDKVDHSPMEPVRNFVWSCFGTPWKYSVLIKDMNIGLWLDIGKYWILDKVDHNTMEPVRKFTWSCEEIPSKCSALINNGLKSERLDIRNIKTKYIIIKFASAHKIETKPFKTNIVYTKYKNNNEYFEAETMKSFLLKMFSYKKYIIKKNNKRFDFKKIKIKKDIDLSFEYNRIMSKNILQYKYFFYYFRNMINKDCHD